MCQIIFGLQLLSYIYNVSSGISNHTKFLTLLKAFLITKQHIHCLVFFLLLSKPSDNSLQIKYKHEIWIIRAALFLTKLQFIAHYLPLQLDKYFLQLRIQAYTLTKLKRYLQKLRETPYVKCYIASLISLCHSCVLIL